MLHLRVRVPLLLALTLAVACDSGTKDAKPGPAPAAPATPEVKADPAAPPAAHGGGGPHGAAANPHGAAANPHAGMPPMMGGMGSAPPSGPPRDITPSGQTATESLPGLHFAVPSEWEKGTPSNSMRLAQWVLPGPGGDAELVVFRFPGGAGGIEANLTRWKGQFTPPEGKSIDDVSTTTKVEAGGLTTTLVDVSGTFKASMTPGAAGAPDATDQRMLAAIVEGSGDPFYFKAVGPKATMDLWASPISAMIGTFTTAAPVPPGTPTQGEPPVAPAPPEAAPPAAEPPKEGGAG